MRRFCVITLMLAVCGSLTAIHADVIPANSVSTSFTAETTAVDPANHPYAGLNFTGFSNWTVTRGSVDLVNLNGGARQYWFGNYQGATPSFSFVDLDGTSRHSGQITSSALTLAPGNYSLSFDAAGNLGRRPNSEGLTVRLNGLGITQHYELASSAGFTTKTIDFTVTNPATIDVSFANESDDLSTLNDDQGPLLANISLNGLTAGAVAVPEPATLILAGGGAVGLFIAHRFMPKRRKLKKKKKKVVEAVAV
ncbi:MAG: PEP-CTERM sorting domain-containing protein [Gemmatales bacterium]